MSPQKPLPDPDHAAETDVVIFDGHCAFCRSQVERLRWFDGSGGRLTFLSLHDPRVAQRYPDLTVEQLMDQMYVVEPDGTAHGGSSAVRYLTRRLPRLWWAVPILHLPGTAGVWRWVYRQIAKRRYRIAGKTCDADTCSVHLR